MSDHKALPELGTIVFQTDGGGVPLVAGGIWEVWSLDTSADCPVELRRLDKIAPSLETTEYRITPVLDHVVADPSEIEAAARADERRQCLLEAAEISAKNAAWARTDEREKLLAEIKNQLWKAESDGPPTTGDSFELGYSEGRNEAVSVIARILEKLAKP